MVKVKVKADIALHGNPISELREVNCHMGSHSVTCHLHKWMRPAQGCKRDVEVRDRDETETLGKCVSRPSRDRDVETETTSLAPPNPSHAGWYSIYLLLRDGRLSWPSWLDSTPAGSRTSDLSIASPMPNHAFGSFLTVFFCLILLSYTLCQTRSINVCNCI